MKCTAAPLCPNLAREWDLRRRKAPSSPSQLEPSCEGPDAADQVTMFGSVAHPRNLVAAVVLAVVGIGYGSRAGRAAPVDGSAQGGAPKVRRGLAPAIGAYRLDMKTTDLSRLAELTPSEKAALGAAFAGASWEIGTGCRRRPSLQSVCPPHLAEPGPTRRAVAKCGRATPNFAGLTGKRFYSDPDLGYRGRQCRGQSR
jgi:hypothetical protein